ncbi:MAG TPA: bifunctional DNA-formamidopyrimidine glycosylase/DNA-(apurinic or apyrimidinic site) lyase [Myxococcota bacterium]|nr:bifunctional DNA-formamidopyrimidine glycosylase/DNA-(apurinic or apyrimidinic site) lyase [Myxococcota bacterium]
MPELPEVEVTRQRIAPLLLGRRIACVETTGDSYFFLTKPAKLRRALPGRTAVALDRHGKYLVVTLDNRARLVLHLGMTGQLFGGGVTSVRLLSAAARASLAPEAQPVFRPDSHTHLRLRFADGVPDILFRDVRKFGKVFLVAEGEVNPRLAKLGVDALRATSGDLFPLLRRRHTAIKNVLLDQSVIAGVGNIYADEALFLAGVRPLRRASRVTRAECERIVEALHQVLRRSIETGGSSISDYLAPDGNDGGYQDERRIYAREGEACRRCGGRVRRIVIGQRSAHFCARCQH